MISFLNIAFLWGLPLVAVPVIVHLLNRRRQDVVRWGAMLDYFQEIAGASDRVDYEQLGTATEGQPFVLLTIVVLLYLIFRRIDEALLIMLSLPIALAGGFWAIYLLGHDLSVASAVGFIALAGVAAEFGVVMLIYLKQALERHGHDHLFAAIDEGAVQRVRPKAMTVAVIVAGLVPIMWSEGSGSEVMQRIAAPMIGGMLTAPLLSMFVIPAAYLLLNRSPKRRRSHEAPR